MGRQALDLMLDIICNVPVSFVKIVLSTPFIFVSNKYIVTIVRIMKDEEVTVMIRRKFTFQYLSYLCNYMQVKTPQRATTYV